ncbi:MAG TPA: hypothetical protein VFH78_06860 [Candidatus Thermoplasmatota archaeon]|nr:hypothetical protein [Candidatus Thermoplasmatota archaeon]
MRALQTLIVLAALVAISGVAAAQNNPCPECDPDGEPADNSYHSVDIGAIVKNETGAVTDEVLADTDVAYSHDNHPKGFWLWFALCLSAFFQHIEDILGIHTDVDANVEVYAESNGVDIDASVYGVQAICAELEVDTKCDFNFDRSAVGDLDGKTWEAVATVEKKTGVDVFVPAVLPDTGDSDTNVCVTAQLTLCG